MGLPVVLLIMLALILIYGFITSRTVPGRQIYAVGGNKKQQHYLVLKQIE